MPLNYKLIPRGVAYLTKRERGSRVRVRQSVCRVGGRGGAIVTSDVALVSAGGTDALARSIWSAVRQARHRRAPLLFRDADLIRASNTRAAPRACRRSQL